MEHQKLRFRKAFFFRLKPLGPPLLTESDLFISFKSHIVNFDITKVPKVTTLPVNMMLTFWASRSDSWFHSSLLSLTGDSGERRGERGGRILLNFMMFGMDFAVATGLCVCGWAGGNWSYFLLILGNAWHSRGRGVPKLYVLLKIRTSHSTKEAKTSFSRALFLIKRIYPFRTVLILTGIGCYVNTPCQCLCGWWRQHQVPGAPSWSPGHAPTNHWRQNPAKSEPRIQILLEAARAWFSVKLASLGLFETKTRLIHHLWALKFQNQGTDPH